MSAAKSPYLVPVHDLMHRPGELRERVLEFPAPEQLGEAVAVVKPGTPIRIDLRLEGLHDGVLVTGEVDTTADGECVRCLDAVELPVEVEFQELFAYSEDEAFDFAIRDDHVNLESVVRDAVVLALPFQPVCRPDCPGLDPITGEKLQDGAVAQNREAADPRWAALEGFQPTETE
ncbi:MAG: DUF177 domain-containing protein [Micrococcales bacterium]|nr:DUF177 domain-containing protein [Micrococcales bacterium]